MLNMMQHGDTATAGKEQIRYFSGLTPVSSYMYLLSKCSWELKGKCFSENVVTTAAELWRFVSVEMVYTVADEGKHAAT